MTSDIDKSVPVPCAGGHWETQPYDWEIAICSICKRDVVAHRPIDKKQQVTPLSEATELAEQWKGRADDAGRLSRAVLSESSQSETRPSEGWDEMTLRNYPFLKDAPCPSTTDKRVEACLHACEGLDTADLAGNEKGWLSGYVKDAVKLELEWRDAEDRARAAERIASRKDHWEAYQTQKRVSERLSAEIASMQSANSESVNVPRWFLLTFIEAVDFHNGHGTPSLQRAEADVLYSEARRLLADTQYVEAKS